MVEELLLGLSSATDTLGVPLLREEMPDEQKHHVHCLQDPPNVLLYTITGHLRKGSVIYRSARGSTSLESFHMHLARFIPGSSANEVNFQAYPYLLDGITRWNYQRYCSSFESLQGDQLRTFNMSLQQARAHSLSLSIYGASVISSYKPPSTYTGERRVLALSVRTELQLLTLMLALMRGSKTLSISLWLNLLEHH